MRRVRRSLVFLLALASSTMLVPDAGAQIRDQPIQPRPQAPPPAQVESVPSIDACRTVPADATGTLDSGDASKASVVLQSAISYADRSRSCRRFVADIAVPGTHVTPSGHQNVIHLGADAVSNPNVQWDCESTVLNAVFFQRTDRATYSQGGLKWTEGSFSSLGSVRLRGTLTPGPGAGEITFLGVPLSGTPEGCRLAPESGAFPSTTAPSGSFMRRILRVAVELHQEVPSGNQPRMVTAGAAHPEVQY